MYFSAAQSEAFNLMSSHKLQVALFAAAAAVIVTALVHLTEKKKLQELDSQCSNKEPIKPVLEAWKPSGHRRAYPR